MSHFSDGKIFDQFYLLPAVCRCEPVIINARFSRRQRGSYFIHRTFNEFALDSLMDQSNFPRTLVNSLWLYRSCAGSKLVGDSEVKHPGARVVILGTPLVLGLQNTANMVCHWLRNFVIKLTPKTKRLHSIIPLDKAIFRVNVSNSQQFCQLYFMKFLSFRKIRIDCLKWIIVLN